MCHEEDVDIRGHIYLLVVPLSTTLPELSNAPVGRNRRNALCGVERYHNFLFTSDTWLTSDTCKVVSQVKETFM